MQQAYFPPHPPANRVNLPIRYNRPLVVFVAAIAMQMPIPIVRKVNARRVVMRVPVWPLVLPRVIAAANFPLRYQSVRI
jgi:hypothetical protein